MRKAIFSLLVAVAAMPATAQLRSDVSPSSNHLHSPFFVKKTSEKTPSPMRHISPKAAPNAAFGVFTAVFLLYFLICWPVSRLAGYLEKRWS